MLNPETNKYVNTASKRLSAGFVHAFTIPGDATKITVYGRFVNGFGSASSISDYTYENARGIQNHMHYTHGTIFGDDAFSRRGIDDPSGFESFFNELAEEFEDAGGEIAEGFEDLGAEIEWAAVKFGKAVNDMVLAPLIAAAEKEFRGLIEDTTSSWKAAFLSNPDEIRNLYNAIESGDGNAAFVAVANLIVNNVGLRTMIENAKDGEMGSIIFSVSAGGGSGVGVDGSIGNAFDLNSLVHLATHGSLPNDNRTVMSSFVGGGISIGATGGGGADVLIGWDTNSPADAGGPSFDVNIEGKSGGGASVTFSFDPSDAMNRSGITLGAGAGLEVDISAGIGYTHVISTVTCNDLRSLVR